MLLTIKAVSYKGESLIPPLSAVFDDKGGTLGRSLGNHLVLADDEKVISGEHAIIQYENGSYYYIDTSLNGSLIINRNEKVHNTKILLKDQDQLRIGDYDLVLSISGEASDTPPPLSGLSPDPLTFSVFNQTHTDIEDSLNPSNSGNNNAPLNLNQGDPHENSNVISTLGQDFDAPINDSVIQPEPENKWDRDPELPDDLSLGDFFKTEMHTNEVISNASSKRPQSPSEKPTPKQSNQSLEDPVDNRGIHAAQPRVQHGNSEPPVHRRSDMPPTVKEKHDERHGKDVKDIPDLLEIFFKAAGIENVDDIPKEDSPGLMHTVGTVFRELVDGLMTVIRGRAELKSQFRVSMTVLKPSENNPLKFTPTVEELIKALLVDKHPGFVSAVDAVHEGYEDIMNHQLAITAGVQASLKSILKRFDPQSVSDKHSGRLALLKKIKCWDEYSKAYEQIAGEALEDFFGDDFVRAYDEQISKLHTSRKPK